MVRFLCVFEKILGHFSRTQIENDFLWTHSMPIPSTVEQRERVIEVAKTKQEILQKEREILSPGLDTAAQKPSKRWMKDQYFQMSEAEL